MKQRLLRNCIRPHLSLNTLPVFFSCVKTLPLESKCEGETSQPGHRVSRITCLQSLLLFTLSHIELPGLIQNNFVFKGLLSSWDIQEEKDSLAALFQRSRGLPTPSHWP